MSRPPDDPLRPIFWSVVMAVVLRRRLLPRLGQRRRDRAAAAEMLVIDAWLDWWAWWLSRCLVLVVL